MGLMSFLKNAGEKIGLVAPDAPAEPTVEQQAEQDGHATVRIQQHLDSLGLGAEGLAVVFQKGTVILMGTADSQATREKLVLTVGNLEGVEAVDDRLEVANPAPEAVFHTVSKGDTLSALARDYYGVLGMYDEIFEANRPMLSHPDKIYPGQVLRIPPVTARQYEIQKGDTLSGIAKKFYGDFKSYTRIYEANREVIANPDVVEAGWQIRIPLVDPKVPGCDA